MAYPARQHVLNVFKQLVKLLPAGEQAKPQIILLAGEKTPFRNDTDREMLFRQESNFFYLSGCNVPSSHLLLFFQAGTSLSEAPASHLFIPEPHPEDIMWSPPPPSLAEASRGHDVTTVKHTKSLSEEIELVLQAFPDGLFHTLPRSSPLFPALSDDYTASVLSAGAAVTDLYLLPALHRARLIKDAAEIALIRHATDISSRAHETVMRVLGQAVKGRIERGAGAGVDRPLLPGEWLIEKEAEAEGIFVASCRREGAVHQAYLPIVAASNRASTLHYCCNDREFAWGPVEPHDHREDFAREDRKLLPQVLLIDAGCEWSCYASDLTRTMPVGNGGKFSPEARSIYELVLAMQRRAMEMVKPGVHWDKVHLLCHKILVNGFLSLGIFKTGNAETLLQTGLSNLFYPHGLGHSLGMDVHDVPSASKPFVNTTIPQADIGHPSFYNNLRLRLPLEENMIITVEPGIYFHPHLLAPIYEMRSEFIDYDVLKKYEGMGGVRIEDVVRVTADGCENLTKVKSDTEWVEGVCSGDL
ncbi:Creatinase/aminopeptidase [Fistulina hepatica ATCC 64428]|uniref:Creatinase/aminopeptidase n=1 Tax=Fistulina hepatica ATCC 64428 TaxID=1128425 RepID=A0A0D7A2M0_9AGAR|nr:Creatinase/aminopeptidase [Fistulina hepatica ATCC 64428]